MNSDKTEMEEIEIVFEDFEDDAGEAEGEEKGAKKPEPKEPKQKKPKKKKPQSISVGGMRLDNKCCVIRTFDEMQQAKRILNPLAKTFPQFGLPFMYDDDLSTWPVRVDNQCWRCDGTKAREWTFMYDEEALDQIHICEECETLSPCMTISYPEGKLAFTPLIPEEHWEAMAEFENDWDKIYSRAKAENTSLLRFLSRVGYWGRRLISGPTPEEKKRKEERLKAVKEAKAAEDKAREERAKEDKAKREKAKEEKAKKDKAKREKAKEEKAKEDKAKKEKPKKDKPKKEKPKEDKPKKEKPKK